MRLRASGILLHITSLPSRFGIGDLGPAAYEFVDFLARSKQRYWQIIPLTPPNPQHYSPYHSPSAFAGNLLLISPELLVEQGLLTAKDIEEGPNFPSDTIDFPTVISYKSSLLDKAFERFRSKPRSDVYNQFLERNKAWLQDHTLFRALSGQFSGHKWNEWPDDLRDRQPKALQEAARTQKDAIEKEEFIRYTFFAQWFKLKEYCNGRRIHVIGDLPVYVDFHSADVWANPSLFKLNEEKRPYVVAGVPPDYFSPTGQLWGHPIYDWKAIRNEGYSWWIERIGHNLKQCDVLRIDHFRGFAGYWEVPAEELTALNGQWQDGPGAHFFSAILRRFPQLPIIAEDLGVITPDVRELMRQFDFPGMKVLLFAFDENLPSNPYAPHNLVRNSVVFTGTHDNNTVRGWFENEATEAEKARLFSYLGRDVPPDIIHWEMVRLALMSVADTAILAMQDVLGLGGEARMNLPSQKEDNWHWRLTPDRLSSQLEQKLRAVTEIYGRA